MTKMKLGDYIINVNNICKTFPNGVKALCNFTTNIRRAEVVVVIGPSGSGKSTFLRCLNGWKKLIRAKSFLWYPFGSSQGKQIENPPGNGNGLPVL